MTDEEFPAAGRRKAATIADVAEVAGVAIGTVSRFLNGREIRRSNRLQIEAAIEKLSYRRNAVAAAMKTDRTHMIGVLIPTFDEFHAQMVERLSSQLRSTGRALVMYFHGHEPQLFADALDFFTQQRVDGLIMDSVQGMRQRVEAVIAEGIPVVLYNNDIAGVVADRVAVENAAVSQRVVSHLLDLGHERVAMISGDLVDSSARQRLDGYEAALRERGLAVDPAYIICGHWRAEGGYEAARQLMQLPKPPTAIFAANYGMAIGVLMWMKNNGLHLPTDLSLISFDDVPLFRLHEPGITAIAQPINGIADSIANLLVARLGPGEPRPIRSITLGCDIILRGSTGRPQR